MNAKHVFAQPEDMQNVLTRKTVVKKLLPKKPTPLKIKFCSARIFDDLVTVGPMSCQTILLKLVDTPKEFQPGKFVK